MGKPLTGAPTRQLGMQSPGRRGKAKTIGHGGAVVFAIFGKDEVLSSKQVEAPNSPKTLAHVSSVF